MKYRAIIFDWDGTLHDSVGYIIACFKKAAADRNFPVPSSDAIKSIIPLLSDELMGPFYQQYYDRLNAPILFPGVKEVIEQLFKHGVLLGIATAKSRADLTNDLLRSGLSTYFLALRCGGETAPKPNPQMLIEIMESLKVQPSEALVVGDMESDMLLAKNAGVDALAVTYGIGKVDSLSLHSPVGYLSDIQQLLEWLDIHSSPYP